MGVIGEKIPFIIGEGEEKEEIIVEQETYQGTIANVRYNHMAYPWDAPLSYGVQAFIEYNGLIMNDRYRSDVIRVTGITGLDDAEVRDAREDKAGAHGEFPYAAYYGGRNLVLNGYFEAGSLQVLKYLEKILKAAFAPLEESPLKFRWFDITDTFDDPRSINEYKIIPTKTSGNYTSLVGSTNNLKIENGQLSWKSIGENIALRSSEQRLFSDAQATLEITLGSYSNSSAFIACGVKSSNEYVRFVFIAGSNPALWIQVLDETGGSLLKDIEIPASIKPVVGQTFWLRGKKEENFLTAEFWNTFPENDSEPTFSISSSLTGVYSEKFGNKVLSQMGFGGYQADTLWRFGSFKIESMYPGDVEFQARKLSPISIKDEQTSLTKFKRAFQIAMKTSDFRAFSSTQLRKEIEPSTSSSNSSLGRSYPRKYPLEYRNFISTSIPLQENILNINNRGNIFVEPIIYFYGPTTAFNMKNLTNEQEISWLGNLAENDYLVINCKEETIENSLGSNYLEPLSASSDWIKLEPMWNEIFISGNGFSSATKVVVYYRHGTK